MPTPKTSFSPDPRILNKKQLAARLGKGDTWLNDHMDELVAKGFPLRDPLLDGWYWQPSASARALGFRAESLGKDRLAAIARAEALNAAVDAERRGKEAPAAPVVAPGTVSHLIATLQASSHWRKKAERTVEEIEFAFSIIEPEFGATQAARVTAAHVETFYSVLLKEGSVHRAAKIMTWARYLWSFAIKQQYARLAYNPWLAVEIERPAPRVQVWEPAQITAVIKAARKAGRPCMAMATVVAYDTSLRLGDVLALKWSQYDGESLWLTTQKTEHKQRVPLYPETIAALDKHRRSGGIVALDTAPIIRAPHGRAYVRMNFSQRFRDICRAAGLPDDLRFQDIRRTASKERAEGGASEVELAAATGHSIQGGSRILDTYNPRSYAQAQAAQAKRRQHKEKNR